MFLPRLSVDRRTDVLCVLVIFLFAAVPFWPFILQGKAFLPIDILLNLPPWVEEGRTPSVYNPIHSDAIRVYYPWLDFAHDVVRDGVLPLWNPYLFSGVPHLANSLTSTLYPLAWAFFVLPVWVAYSLLGLAHFFLAGLFMYLYLRKIHLHAGAALFGALAFMFNGFFVAWMEIWSLVATGIWLPAILLLTEQVVTTRRVPWGVLLAITLAVPIYAGHAQVAFYVFLGSAAYWVLRSGSEVWRSPSEKRLRAGIAYLALSVLVWGTVPLLAAAQWLPSWELSQYIGRQREGPEVMAASQLALRHLAVFLFPDSLGNPVDGVWWGRHNYAETQLFVGVWPLALGAVAIASRRDKYTWFFLALSLFALGIMFNVHPISDFFYRYIPFADRFRAHARIIYLLDTSLSVLGALGLDHLLGNRRWKARAGLWSGIAAVITVALLLFSLLSRELMSIDWGRLIGRTFFDSLPGGWTHDDLWWYLWRQALRFAVVVALGAAALVLAWRRPAATGIALAVLVAVTGGDLAYGASRYATFNDPSLLDVKPRIVAAMERDGDLFRIARYVGTFLIFTQNYPSVYGLYDTQGSSSYVLTSYLEFLGLTRPQGIAANEAENVQEMPKLKSKLIDLMNVKYVVTTQEIHDPEFVPVETSGNTKLYLNRDWLPRAFVVYRKEVVPEKEQALTKLTSQDFDPSQVVLLQRDSQPFGRSGPPGPAQVRIVSYEPNAVAVEVTLPQDGYLVLSDSYYPGWNAYVDGERAEVLRAYHTFRAVHLRPGRHLVQFKYEPGSFLWGARVSAMTLGILTAGVGLAMAKARRQSARL